MNNKKIIALMLATILVGGSTIPASATPQPSNVIEAEKKYEELESKIAEIQDKIYDLDCKIEPLQETISKNEKEITEINNSIESTTKYIEQCKKDITELDKALGERVSTMYKSGTIEFSYLGFVLEAESTKDLFGRIQALSNIIGKDKKSIEEVESKKKEMNEKIESLEVKKKDIDKLTEETEASLKELEVKKQEQEVFIKEAKEERKKFDSEYLSKYELKTVEPQFDVINNSNSSIEQLNDAINKLRGVRDTSIKSPIAETKINEMIEKAKADKEAKEKKLKEEKLKEEKKQTQTSTNITSNNKPSSNNNASSSNNTSSSNSNTSTSNSGDTSSDNSSAPDPAKVSALLNEAYKHLGKPYKSAATGPDSFDCSGFTQYVYKHGVNISISRTTFTQINDGRRVSQANLQPGDLVFTHAGHVGIYVGSGQMIHAPHTGDVVKIGPVYKFYAGVRIL